MRILLFSFLLLCSKIHSQDLDKIQGEWVSNKFGYLKITGNNIQYEFYWYESAKERKNTRTERTVRIRRDNPGLEDKLISSGIFSNNGNLFFTVGEESINGKERYKNDTLNLIVKGNDTLLLIDPIIPNSNDTLIYTRYETGENLLKTDSIEMYFKPPFTANNGYIYGLGDFWHPTLVIHNDSIFCMYGKKHVGLSILLNKETVDELNKLLAHFPNQYSQNCYEPYHTITIDYSPPDSSTGITICKPKGQVYGIENNGFPYLLSKNTSITKQAYFSMMDRFSKSIYNQYYTNFAYDSSGFAGHKYVYKGDVKHGAVVKGNPRLIKRFMDSAVYLLKIDTVIYNATGYYKLDNTVYFIAGINNNADSEKINNDNSAVFFIKDAKPYMDEQPPSHRLYFILQRTTTIPAAHILINFKLDIGLVRPASGMMPQGETMYLYAKNWNLKPDKYDKCIEKYMKKHNYWEEKKK